jgi:hypothetical protein
MSRVFNDYVDANDDNSAFEFNHKTMERVKTNQQAKAPPVFTVLERLRADKAAGRLKAYREVYPVDPPHVEREDAFEDGGDDE